MTYVLRDYHRVSSNEAPLTLTCVSEDQVVDYIQSIQPDYFDYAQQAKGVLSMGYWEYLARVLYRELSIDLIKIED